MIPVQIDPKQLAAVLAAAHELTLELRRYNDARVAPVTSAAPASPVAMSSPGEA